MSTKATPPPPAYFLSLSLENVRSFGEKQAIHFTEGGKPDGKPAQWTIILGDNGVGKTTVLKALGRASVVGYGLNRKELLDYRRDYLRCLRNQEFLARILDHNPPVVDLELLVATYGSAEELSLKIAQARLDHQKAARATEQYAGMVRANFPHLPAR